MSQPLILVVDNGDTTRAPLAKALLQTWVPQLQLSPANIYQVQSASVTAEAGSGSGSGSGSAIPEVRKVASEHRVDLSRHRPQVVSRPLLEQAALIVVMDSKIKKALMASAPTVADKICDWQMTSVPQPRVQIPDPRGKTIDDYRRYWAFLEDTGGLLSSKLSSLSRTQDS